MCSPKAAQWPQTTVAAALFRSGTRNQGMSPGGCRVRGAFVREPHVSFRRADAQLGQGIGNDRETLAAGQAVGPAAGTAVLPVTDFVEIAQELRVTG